MDPGLVLFTDSLLRRAKYLITLSALESRRFRGCGENSATADRLWALISYFATSTGT
jgi:hypothetical protein